MRSIVRVTLLVLGTTLGTALAQNAVEENPLIGSWQVESAQRRDKAKASPINITIHFSPNSGSFESDGTVQRFTYNVDMSNKPAKITFVFSEDDASDVVMGIWRRNDSKLTLCLSDLCSHQELDAILCGPIERFTTRPTQFSPSNGSLMECVLLNKDDS